jgi:hypothetical protein
VRRHFLFGTVVAIGCLTAAALGEQQVKLQSGTTLVGDVTMNGTTLVVDVDGAKIEVPFKEVASVAPAANDEAAQAKQLLVKGLESQILSKEEPVDSSLFSEAYRLAPEDPHVAFWYARSLMKAGYGKGASEIFEPKRAAIIAAYPGVGERLASQIADRIAMEKLPAGLVKRLDQIAAAAEKTAGDSEYLNYAAYFQLLDQSGKPIEQSAFRLECSGEDEQLEAFHDGYYLSTFRRRRSFSDGRCELTMIKSNVLSDPFTFSGSYHGPEDVGTLRVKRLDDADRRPVVVKVVDTAGKPIAGATVSVYRMGRSGGESNEPPATTSADGTARLNLFPHDYSCRVYHEDYAQVGQTFVVPADAKATTDVNAQLHRAITAKIKAAWRSKIAMHPGMPGMQDDAVTTGEFEQQIGPNNRPGPAMGRFGPQWVQLVQKGDQVQLEFVDRMHFPTASAPWVGRWKRDAGAGEQPEKPEEYGDVFDMLDLAQLSAIKSELQLEVTNLAAMPGQGRPVNLPMEEGDIYLGRISGQDPQTGRPSSIEFKILAVEVKRP